VVKGLSLIAVMSVQPVMLMPIPRAGHWGGLSSSPTPRTPSEGGLYRERPFWFDHDEASQELREVLGGQNKEPNVLSDWVPSFKGRPLSSASTTIGQTPDIDNQPGHIQSVTPPMTPELDLPPSLDKNTSSVSPAHAQYPKSPCDVLDPSSRVQDQKVFVGGIPQKMDKNDLHNMFSKLAKVKKAWLQMNPADSSWGHAATGKQHRGFGFVIFAEKGAVDRLLGQEASRFIWLGDNRRLEVKRAVGKTRATAPTPRWNQASASTMQGRYGSAPPPGTFCTRQSTPLQSSRASFEFPARCEGQLPHVPPLPSFGVSRPQWPGSSIEPVAQSLRAKTVATQQQGCPLLYRTLLDCGVGQKPCNGKDLELMLLQAMPDHYDD